MSKGRTVHVSSAQKQAAKALVSRSAKTGRFVSSSVAKIANARNPRTTLVERSTGSTGSATTGRYVATGAGQRQPTKTATQDD